MSFAEIPVLLLVCHSILLYFFYISIIIIFRAKELPGHEAQVAALGSLIPEKKNLFSLKLCITAARLRVAWLIFGLKFKGLYLK